MQEETLREKHECTLNTQYWIARSLYKKKQFRDAEIMFAYLENMQEGVLVEKHANI